MDKPLKTPPPHAIARVDHALRAAVMLQLEGGLKVTEVAERLGVARSTAHRLLAIYAARRYQDRPTVRTSRRSAQTWFASVARDLP